MGAIYLLACVDGTGSRDWRRSDGYNSHVYRFYRDFSTSESLKAYWHGPDLAGMQMTSIVDGVFNWLCGKMEQEIQHGAKQDDIKICLVGHSRGAVAVACAANALESDRGFRIAVSKYLQCPVKVGFVGMYDAVDRAMFESADTALGNVGKVLHGRRKNISTDPEKGSRGTFGTVDFGSWPQPQYDTAHGGVGGDPGYFTELGEMASDYYCNAMTCILSQAEIDQRYGVRRIFDPESKRSETFPKYSALTGEARRKRLAFLANTIKEGQRVDTDMRRAAGQAGFTFGGGTSHCPYGASQGALWQRLVYAIAGS